MLVNAATRGQPRPEQASCAWAWVILLLVIWKINLCYMETTLPGQPVSSSTQAPPHSEPHLRRGLFNMTQKDLMPLARKARSGRY